MRTAFAVCAMLVLSGCPWVNPDVPVPPPPGPRPTSGRLLPEALELSLTVGATDGQSNQSETSAIHVTLVNGRLPVDVFAPQRTSLAAAIAGWPIEDAKKVELTTGVNDALDKLTSDLNKSLDGLPRRMAIAVTSPPLGATFDFTNVRGERFVADGLYNSNTTEYFLGALQLGNGSSTDQLALLGLAAATFSGRLNSTLAELRLNATGLLGVANVGVVSVSIELKASSRYTND